MQTTVVLALAGTILLTGCNSSDNSSSLSNKSVTPVVSVKLSKKEEALKRILDQAGKHTAVSLSSTDWIIAAIKNYDPNNKAKYEKALAADQSKTIISRQLLEALVAKLNIIPAIGAVFSTSSAFAALRSDGTVVTWGNKTEGGDISNLTTPLVNVVSIFSNETAFVALKSDGTIITWGNPLCGGDSSKIKKDLTDIVSIYATDTAFSALKSDGTVITWGQSSDGGDSSSIVKELKNVVSIFSTESAFTALKTDGSVVSWGNKDAGNNLTKKLTDVAYIFSTNKAFSALKSDGSVKTWGDGKFGGG